MTRPLTVDIWSDIACPFCYIGKRRFEAAVRATGLQVQVTFRSFLLQPDAALEAGAGHAELLAGKLRVSLDQAREMEQKLALLASTEGLVLDYARLQQTNTHRAHQLAHLAGRHGLQAQMVERLMSAYFSEGRHVGRVPELVALAREVGLDGEEVENALTAGDFAQDVEADRRLAAEYGITGVPFFLIEHTYAVSGAQDQDVFRDALLRAVADRDVA